MIDASNETRFHLGLLASVLIVGLLFKKHLWTSFNDEYIIIKKAFTSIYLKPEHIQLAKVRRKPAMQKVVILETFEGQRFHIPFEREYWFEDFQKYLEEKTNGRITFQLA